MKCLNKAFSLSPNIEAFGLKKMWSRFGIFALCYFAVVYSLPQQDRVLGQNENLGGLLPGRGEITGFSNQKKLNRNEQQNFQGQFGSGSYREDESNNHRPNNEGRIIGRGEEESAQNLRNREKQISVMEPSEFTSTSDNTNRGQSSAGFGGNNQPHLAKNPEESSISTNSRENERRTFGSLMDNIGGSSFNRPKEGSFGVSPVEDDRRPVGYKPINPEGSTFNRPVGSSGSIESGFSNTGGGSFNQPAGSSGSIESGFSNTGGGSFNQPASLNGSIESGFGNTGGSSFNRPTGGSIHSSSNVEFGQRPSLKPTNDKNQSGRPNGVSNGNQQSVYSPSSVKQPVGSEQIDSFNQNVSEHDHTEKEEDKDVCYNYLGCFKMGQPWKSVLRPIGAPHSPELIQTTLHFYSRANLESPINITLYPNVNMRNAPFDPAKISVIVVHGFANSGNATWMKDLKNVYLKKVDANVMIVDWGKGAQLLNYLQVAGNTRVVGKQLGLFVKFLMEKFGADPGKFHLIGHSLGAQICSYIGKEVRGIARLTALDPAQPGFEGFDQEVRLHKTDAEFVDVIHTDARPFIPTLGFGMIAPHGHVDFYMNGGFDQPGCLPPPKKELPTIKNFLDFAKYPVEVISKTISCPHARAYEYLIESFNETENCIFWGHKADVKNVFKSVTNTVTQGLLKKFTALSPTCSKDDCIPVGFATKKSPLRGVFVVTTNNRSPYCISEPGIPPEIPPNEGKQNSLPGKLGKQLGIVG